MGKGGGFRDGFGNGGIGEWVRDAMDSLSNNNN